MSYYNNNSGNKSNKNQTQFQKNKRNTNTARKENKNKDSKSFRPKASGSKPPKLQYTSTALGDEEELENISSENIVNIGSLTASSETLNKSLLDRSFVSSEDYESQSKQKNRKYPSLPKFYVDGLVVFYKIEKLRIEQNFDENEVVLIALCGNNDIGYFDPFSLDHWRKYANKHVRLLFYCLKVGYGTTLIRFLVELGINEILLDVNPYDINLTSRYSSYPRSVLDVIQGIVNVKKIDDCTYSWVVNETKISSIISSRNDDKNSIFPSTSKYQLGPFDLFSSTTSIGKLLYDQMLEYRESVNESDKMFALSKSMDIINNSQLVNYGNPVTEASSTFTNAPLTNTVINVNLEKCSTVLSSTITHLVKPPPVIKDHTQKKVFELPTIADDPKYRELSLKKEDIIAKHTPSATTLSPNVLPVSHTPVYSNKFRNDLIEVEMCNSIGGGVCGTSWILFYINEHITTANGLTILLPVIRRTFPLLQSISHVLDKVKFEAEFADKKEIDISIFRAIAALASLTLTPTDLEALGIYGDKFPRYVYYERHKILLDDIVTLHIYKPPHFVSYALNRTCVCWLPKNDSVDRRMSIRITETFDNSIDIDKYSTYIGNCLQQNIPFDFPLDSTHNVDIRDYRLIDNILIFRTSITNKYCLGQFCYITCGSVNAYYSLSEVGATDCSLNEQFVFDSGLSFNRYILWFNFIDNLHDLLKEYDGFLLNIGVDIKVVYIYIYDISDQVIDNVIKEIRTFECFHRVKFIAIEQAEKPVVVTSSHSDIEHVAEIDKSIYVLETKDTPEVNLGMSMSRTKTVLTPKIQGPFNVQKPNGSDNKNDSTSRVTSLPINTNLGRNLSLPSSIHEAPELPIIPSSSDVIHQSDNQTSPEDNASNPSPQEFFEQEPASSSDPTSINVTEDYTIKSKEEQILMSVRAKLAKREEKLEYGIFMDALDSPVPRVISKDSTNYVKIDKEILKNIRELLLINKAAAVKMMLDIYYDSDV